MGGKILIVDDVATNRIVMKVKLTAAGYLPVVAADGASALALAAEQTPNLILLDYGLPDMPGPDVLRQLRADPVTRRVPVVVFSASQSPAARIAAFEAGADDFLVKPIDDQTLLARIRSLMRSHGALSGLSMGLDHRTSSPDLDLPDLDLEDLTPPDPGFADLAPPARAPALPVPGLSGLAEAPADFHPTGAVTPSTLTHGTFAPCTIALVMQRPETALFLRRHLATKLAGRILTLTAEGALSNALQDGPSPDLFVIEADLPLQGGGLRLMSELRSRSATQNARFALYRHTPDDASAAMAFDLGTDDVIDAATAPQEIALRLQRLLLLKRKADRLRLSVTDHLRLAMIDPLTGLHNRRYGLARMQAIAEAAQTSGAVFAVLVADIDQFKSVNDRFGHGVGDAVLVQVAERLRQNLRAGDLLARIGGEEFLIALPDIALAEARSIAERLCSMMSDAPFDIGQGRALPVTISIGLAISEAGAAPAHLETVTEIVDRADRALMRSKAAGRNQVTIGRTAA
jgi:two-component system cell cycle response regulator